MIVNNSSDFLLISDLHLEKKSITQQNFILNTINEAIVKSKILTSKNPVLVCAGDIHNGKKGLDFLSKINTQVIYICGNHEFWDHDYEQVLEDIKNNCPANVTFLHNDFTVVNDTLFIGGTLWTDLGQHLNPDLITTANNTMNDSVYIKYKAWYEKEQNITKLKSYYNNTNNAHLDDIINKKLWNVLIEKEENLKTLQYIENFNEVYQTLLKIDQVKNALAENIDSKFSFMSITKKEYEEKIKKLDSYKNENDYERWLNSNQDTISDHATDDKSIRNTIFNKLKNYQLENLKIVLVSHHVPFIEERMIGRHNHYKNNDVAIKNNTTNNKIINYLPENIYNVKKGLDYPYHNYFYRISKGEFNKDENVLHVIHYHNDGANNLPLSFIDKLYCAVHGHEHTYNFEDILKGIKIATNPLAYSMDILNCTQSTVSLNSYYKNYHKIDNEHKEIENIKKSLVKIIHTNLTKEQMQKAADIYVLKNVNYVNYLALYNHIDKANKNLLKMLVRHKNWKHKISEDEHFSVIAITDSIDFSINKMIEIDKLLRESVYIRKSVDFSLNKQYSNAIETDGIEYYIKAISEPLSKFNTNNHFEPSVDYDTFMFKAFANISYIKQNIASLKKCEKIVNSIRVQNIEDIDNASIIRFEKAFESKELLYKFQIEKIIQDNFQQFKIKHNIKSDSKISNAQ